jgi:hypothetical protein
MFNICFETGLVEIITRLIIIFQNIKCEKHLLFFVVKQETLLYVSGETTI